MFDEERAGTDGQPQPRSAGLSDRAHGTGKQQGFRVTRTGKWSHEEIAERIGGAASIQHKELLGTRQKLTTVLSSPLPWKKGEMRQYDNLANLWLLRNLADAKGGMLSGREFCLDGPERPLLSATPGLLYHH